MAIRNNSSDRTDKVTESVKKRKERMLDCVTRHWPSITNACAEAKLSRETYYQYLRTDKNFARAVRDLDEGLIDKAESVIGKHLEKEDAKVAMWFLEHRAKSRGYGDKLEVTGPNEGPLEIVIRKTIVTRKQTNADD